MDKWKRYIKKALIGFTILSLCLLNSCIGGGSGGGFDIIKFLQNPLVIFILIIIIVWYIMNKKK
jgi:fumarate reductase subunit C